MIRKHFYFDGYVQGVGFRYRASWLAGQLQLTGWVRNLSDGRVEMEVQGREADVEHLVVWLKNERFIEIRDVESEEIPVVEGEGKFKIKY